MYSRAERLGLTSHPLFWLLLLLAGAVFVIKPAAGTPFFIFGGKDEDGDPTNLALAVTRAAGVIMSVMSVIALILLLNK